MAVHTKTSFQIQKRTTFQSNLKIQLHSVVFVPCSSLSLDCLEWISDDFKRNLLHGIKNTERRQIPLSSPENLELINHFDQRHKEVEGVWCSDFFQDAAVRCIPTRTTHPWWNDRFLKGAASTGYCCVRSFLCWGHYFVSLPIQKVLL